MVRWPANADELKITQWVPFSSIYDESGNIPATKIREVLPGDVYDDATLALAPPQRVAALHQGAGEEGDEAWEWLRDKLIVHVGTSRHFFYCFTAILVTEVDAYNLQDRGEHACRDF